MLTSQFALPERSMLPAEGPLCPVLVGRTEEQRILGRLISGLDTGAGATVLLSGPAGVGKSRLLRALGEAAQAGGATVLLGRCWSSDDASPYQPFAELLQQMWRPPRSEAAWVELARTAPEVAALIPGLSVPAATGDAAEGDINLREAVLRLFASRARTQPLVLMLEDLQWADPSSLALLGYLSRSLAAVPGLLLAATYRDDELHAHERLAKLTGTLRREHLAVELELSPLARDEVEEFIAQTLGPRAARRNFAEALWERSGGSPLFIEELLRAMIAEGGAAEEGLVEGGAAERFTAAAVTSAPLPATVRQAFQERLRPGSLRGEERQLLRAIAVADSELPFELLLELTGLSAARALAGLHRLRELQLVNVWRPREGERFELRHTLIREAVLDEMLAAERASLHERVARTLESRPQAAAQVPARLALHWAWAAVPEPACAWAERAGDAALARMAPEQALTHFQGAIDWLERMAHDQGRRAALLEKALQAARRARDPAAELRYVEELRLDYAAREEWELWSRLALPAVCAYMAVGEREASYRVLGEAWALLERIPSGAARVRARSHLLRADAWLALVEGDHARLEDSAREMAELARATDQPELELRARFMQGVARARVGDRQASDQLLTSALHDAESAQLPYEVALISLNRACFLRSPVLFEAAVEAANQAGDAWLGAHGRDALAMLAWLRAEPAALAMAQDAVDRMRRAAPGTLCAPLATLAHVLITQGELEAARRALGEALPLALSQGDPQWSAATRGALSWLAAEEQDWASARRHGLAALEQCERVGYGYMELGALTLPFLVLAEVKLGHLKAARSAAQRGVLVARLRGDEWSAAQAEVSRALAAGAHRLPELGRLESAAQALEGMAPSLSSQAWLWAAQGAQAGRHHERARRALRQATRLAGASGAARVAAAAAAGLEATAPRTALQREAEEHGGLSRREREVVALVAAGLTNREIGLRLHLSERTVDMHVSRMLAKLGFRARAQLSGWAAHEGLD